MMSGGFTLIFLLIWLCLILLMISSQVFLALCIYNDAKYRLDHNAGLWAALSGFNFITAIVYLILRAGSKNKPRRCSFCGAFMAPEGIYCPWCGRMRYLNTPEDTEKYDRKRKLFLGLWIGSSVALIALYVFVMVFEFSFIFGMSHMYR